MKDNYKVDLKTFDNSSPLKKKFGYRPTAHILISAVFGVVFVLSGSMVLIAFGLFFLGLGAAAFFLIEEKTVVELHQDYLLIFDEEDNTYAIHYDAVNQYYFDENERIYVLETADDTSFTIRTTSGSFDEEMRQLAPNKERFAKMQKEYKERKKARKKKGIFF